MTRDLSSSAVFVKSGADTKPQATYGERVAIIGAGPAGLSCAYQLALKGYRPVVFEKERKPGGMLTYGVPAFRFKRSIIEEQVDELRQMRVSFEMGINVGEDLTLEELRKDRYKAFFIAIGCQGGRKLHMPGEDNPGIRPAVEFLKEASEGSLMQMDGPVVVVGSGDVAIDTARCAKRHVGKGKVVVVCPEGRSEMPAQEGEIRKAISEGVILQPGWGIHDLRVRDERIVGLTCKKCLGVRDRDGAFSPRYNDNDLLEIDSGQILVAIGERVVWGRLLEGQSVVLGKGQLAVADVETARTAQVDIFAGGDVCTGPATVAEAVEAGERGAVGIHRYLRVGDRETGIKQEKPEKESGRHGLLSLFGRSVRQK